MKKDATNLNNPAIIIGLFILVIAGGYVVYNSQILSETLHQNYPQNLKPAITADTRYSGTGPAIRPGVYRKMNRNAILSLRVPERLSRLIPPSRSGIRYQESAIPSMKVIPIEHLFLQKEMLLRLTSRPTRDLVFTGWSRCTGCALETDK